MFSCVLCVFLYPQVLCKVNFQDNSITNCSYLFLLRIHSYLSSIQKLVFSSFEDFVGVTHLRLIICKTLLRHYSYVRIFSVGLHLGLKKNLIYRYFTSIFRTEVKPYFFVLLLVFPSLFIPLSTSSPLRWPPHFPFTFNRK